MSCAVAFFVEGRAKPKGSPRCICKDRFGRPLPRPVVIHDTDAAKAWQAHVKAVSRRHVESLIDGPVELYLEFIFARPRTHWTKTGRLSADGRRMPAPGKNCGDWDKLARNVGDALEGVAYLDDTRIVWGAVSKRWHRFDESTGKMEPEGVHIRISPADLEVEA